MKEENNLTERFITGETIFLDNSSNDWKGVSALVLWKPHFTWLSNANENMKELIKAYAKPIINSTCCCDIQ